MKVVINQDFGGFGLSNEAFERYLDLKGIEWCRVSSNGMASYYHAGHINENDYYLCEYDIERNDPILVQVVEEMGDEANGIYSSLKVVEITDGVEWVIHEYDGVESIHEKHRIWS